MPGQILLVAEGRRPPNISTDSLLLAHGTGLTFYDPDMSTVIKGGDLPALETQPDLKASIDEWVQQWLAIAKNLPPGYTPQHCRDFDIKRYNRLALKLVRGVAACLSEHQQICYVAAKRKGTWHASWLSDLSRYPAFDPEEHSLSAGGDSLKWVRIMPDGISTGLWNSRGQPLLPENLPLPEFVIARIARWAREYNSTVGVWNRRSADNFAELAAEDERIERHAAEGLRIAQAMKLALPDWTIVYFDANLAERFRSRRVYQFEITGTNV